MCLKKAYPVPPTTMLPCLTAIFAQTLSILIQQCWDPAPALRPTFDEILEFLETIARDEVRPIHFNEHTRFCSFDSVPINRVVLVFFPSMYFFDGMFENTNKRLCACLFFFAFIAVYATEAFQVLEKT